MSNNAAAPAAVNDTNDMNAQSNSVPYVIRATFLGVAGILANPTRHTDNERLQTDSSLNFPPPSKLRAVATISRTYKSGGKPSGLSNYLSKPPSSGGGSSEINSSNSAIDTERFVAVWNDDLTEENTNLINTSNEVAFEADLVPSKSPSSKFAPKMFCVTLGLVPDKEENETPNEGGGVSPMVAIPIGFSNLTITGEETLNGRRKQLDLPLTSVNNLTGPFGVESPLIKLTKDGADAIAMPNGEKTKKPKSLVKRMFKKGTKSANVAGQLGRRTNDEERKLFLERFGVDQSGDAIVRVALEVFPRGSELEKTFKQKAKLRKRKQRKQAETKVEATVTPAAIHSYVGERRDDIIAASSSSLVDDADDSSSDSDYSQSYTQISSESNTGTWGDDEETFATFEDTVVTMDTMDTRDLINAPHSTPKGTGVFERMFDCAVPTCTKEKEYVKVDEYNIDAVASAVASMSVSDNNSMSDVNSGKNFPTLVVTTKLGDSAKTKSASDAAMSSTKPPSVTTKPQNSTKAKELDVPGVLKPSPVAIHKPQASTEDALHDSNVAEVLSFDGVSIQLQQSTESHNADMPNDSNLNEELVKPSLDETVTLVHTLSTRNYLTKEPEKDEMPKKKEKTRGFSMFRRNHTTKKDKKLQTAVEETPPLVETVPNEILNQIDEEIEGHEFTLAQHSQNSF
mmetsp:Transcript_11739/g.17997  ORF Transcript_11739/g.17997 Transcript_11739/m.17997 type:complete len:683 (-) Transcript_11739:159-2207(-)